MMSANAAAALSAATSTPGHDFSHRPAATHYLLLGSTPAFTNSRHGDIRR
jgi:hypothetical protein